MPKTKTTPRKLKDTNAAAGAPRVNEPVKKKRRFRPGTRALMEIRMYQKSTQTLVRLAPFTRIVKEITFRLNNSGFRYQPGAIQALLQAMEAYCVGLMEDANLCALHAGRITIQIKDMQLARRINGDFKHR